LIVSPGAKKLVIVFSGDLINAGGQTITNNCKIMAPVEQEDGHGMLADGFANRISIPLNDPMPAGTKVDVLCESVEYFEGTTKKTAKNLKASYTIPTAGSLQDFMLETYEKQVKAAKKTNEDIFASCFVTTSSSGSAGGADISIAPDLKIPNFTPFLQIKKTTQDGSDAKNFEAGGKYQIAFISNKKAYQSIQGMGDKTRAEILAKFNATKKSAYARAFAGSTLDMAFKMEGSAGKFEVTNFVGDSAFVLRSNTAALFGTNGYFRGFLMPVAFEGGQSHANQLAAGDAAETVKPDWIARYKTGLGFRLHFEDTSGKSPIQRLELSGEGVLRNLFFPEAMWDAKTKAVTNTGKGVRAYGQLDLKVYVGESDKGRYGLKLSFIRGSLPPVYAGVKTFQFGFLWESKDAK
jgi:hypothetical protein